MVEDRKIAVSGTPGTGKTTLSKKLSEALSYELLDLNEFIEKENIFELDTDGTKLVETEDLQESFQEIIESCDDGLVIDGLLSHFLSPEQITHVIVLRTRPKVLKKRLSERNFSKQKVEENIEAEALGVIVSEAIEKHGTNNVYEIDTTDKKPDETIKILKKAFEGKKALKPGSIDWLDDYFEKKGE